MSITSIGIRRYTLSVVYSTYPFDSTPLCSRTWKPQKSTFFDRVMELSIAMEKEGYWGGKHMHHHSPSFDYQTLSLVPYSSWLLSMYKSLCIS